MNEFRLSVFADDSDERNSKRQSTCPCRQAPILAPYAILSLGRPYDHEIDAMRQGQLSHETAVIA